MMKWASSNIHQWCIISAVDIYSHAEVTSLWVVTTHRDIDSSCEELNYYLKMICEMSYFYRQVSYDIVLLSFYDVRVIYFGLCCEPKWPVQSMILPIRWGKCVWRAISIRYSHQQNISEWSIIQAIELTLASLSLYSGALHNPLKPGRSDGNIAKPTQVDRGVCSLNTIGRPHRQSNHSVQS